MTDRDFHPDAPTDDEGYPIHPEHGYRICACKKREQSDNTNDEYPFCMHPEAYDVDGKDEGPCTFHGGSSEGASEGNDNAARHEMYAERNAYYQRRSDEQQALIDDIYEDYRDEYERRHGREPLTGDDVKLFGIAVGIHKTEFRADDWADERPDELDTGHELVDRSEKRTSQGEPYYEYKPAAVLRGEKQVSQDVRMWLKDLGLLEPPEDGDTTVNVNVQEEIIEGMKAAHQD